MNKLNLILVLILISSCSTNNKTNDNTEYYKKSKLVSEYWENKAKNNKKYVGHYKVGKAYEIKNKKYYPKNVTKHVEIGIASWYKCDYGFKYCLTANQDIFNENILTAAHKTLPMPCLIKVTNLTNKKSIIVMVNDRGPFKPNRIVDLSEKGASLLGFKSAGLTKVKIEYLDKETIMLRKKLSLPSLEHKYAVNEIANKKCGIRRYINSLNIKYNFITHKDVDMDYKPGC
jgi:rare lipoprotein A